MSNEWNKEKDMEHNSSLQEDVSENVVQNTDTTGVELEKKNLETRATDNDLEFEKEDFMDGKEESEFQQMQPQEMKDAWDNSPKGKEMEEMARREQEKIRQKHLRERELAEQKAAKKEKIRQILKTNPVIRVAKIAGAAVLFGAISFGVMYHLGDKFDVFDKDDSKPAQIIANTNVGNKVEQETSTAITTEQSGSNDTKVNSVTAVDVSDVVEEVMPSIVSITSKTIVQSSNSMEDWFNYYFGFGNRNNGNNDDRYEEQTGAGSGIIIGQNDKELLLVTNNHVVEGADKLEVQFIDKESVDAVVKGTNQSNDLAVVAIKLTDIKAETKDKIKIATLGDSDTLEVGEGAIAIGNALGYGQSVTVGVVSAVERDVTIDGNTMQLVQTDAAINPGNSGGALLNMKGEVIGINAAKYSSDTVEGMGFAIPVSSVADIIEGLMNRETLTKVDEDKKGYLNIYGRDVTEDLATEFNAPKGVLIREVTEGGAAEKAGLEKLDIITALNDQTVESMTDLQEQLEYYEVGTKVTLTVQYLDDKEYKEKKVEVTLGGVME